MKHSHTTLWDNTILHYGSKYLWVLIWGIASLTNGLAQTGPAGVGNATGSGGQKENILWLDAGKLSLTNNDAVATWPDQSGNGNDLVQLGSDAVPFYRNDGLLSGAHSVVRFDGTERYLTLADNNDLDNGLGGITLLAVIYNAVLDNAPRGIYSKRVNSGSQRTYSAFTWTSQRLNFDVHNGGNRRVASSISLNTSTDYIFTNRYNGAIQEIFIQSAASGSRTTSGTISNTASDFILGALNENYGNYFDGDIAELIIYREGLNDGERLIIENYLSQKYNIPITNDFFGTTAGFDPSFINDLMGIGTGDGASKLSSSGVSDALQMTENGGSLNNTNEFIMFAHDNTTHADGVTSNITVDPGSLDSRWARSWYLEATGEVTAELRFDFGTAGLTFSGNASDYVLLYRATTADNYTRVLVNSYTVENGDQLVIDLGNLNLASGYYTIGEGSALLTKSWYSFQSGDWNDPLTWTTVSNGSLREPLGGGIPQPGDNITILSGRTVRMDADDNDGVSLTVNGKLDLEKTSGHNYFSLAGNGIITLEGDVSSNDNFPSGNATLFADSIVGGTVEIIGTGVNLNTGRNYNNLTINTANTTDVVTLLSDYTLNGDLNVQNGILRFSDNAATNPVSMTAYGPVTINSTGQLKVGSGNARHEFNFYGNFTNNGRAGFTNRTSADYNNEATNGIVDANFLNARSDQTVNCNGVTNFYRIEINKGNDDTYVLDLKASSAGYFNLFGPANYSHPNTAQLSTNDNGLGLLAGTVRLNTNVDVPVLNNTGNYNITVLARLWINGGSAEKPSGTAIVPYGTIQLTDGTLNAPVNSGITTRDNGNIIVEGGTMTVNQIRTSVLGADNIGGYTQSGGTVNVTGNSISTSYYVFSLTYPGNTFNMSGGTLNVSGAPAGANTGGIFIASNESNQSVTGGTVVMEVNRNNNFKITSLSPFWNVIMRYTSGTGNEVDLINGSSGTGGNITTINTPDLRVLNDLIIEDGITFDHNGFDVEIGSDFMIQSTGDCVYDPAKPNTTTINGTDNSILSFQNRTGGTNDEQNFWNFVVNKPKGKIVSFASAKTDLTGTKNNLLRINGDAFKVLSGTVDQGFHSIRVYTDTLLNYDVLTVFNSANATPATTSNGDNDQVKFRPDPFVLITADTSRFGSVRLNNDNEIVTLNSDLKIDNLQYLHGRIDLQGNNLKVDFARFDPNGNAEFDFNGNGTIGGAEDKQYNPSDMIITNGLVSAGGLSLLINGNGAYEFPFGVGTDATDRNRHSSKYTPALVTISNFSDDGYITIRPVDDVLPTTDPAGGDILSYYWKVDLEGFTTPPTVDYKFTYYYEDLDGSSNEATFVAGKALEADPFTRNYEDDRDGETEGVNPGINTILFNGPNPDAGFMLEEASYTAGQLGRFVGAPEIYYSRADGNWNSSRTWSTVSHTSSTNAGTFPQAGDIAIVSFNNTNFHRINAVGDVNVAVLEFNSMADATARNIKLSRVLFGANENLNADIVRGTGELQWASSNGNGPGSIHAGTDLGDFVSNSRSSFIYTLGGSGDITIPAIDEYPSLRFFAAGANGSATKTERFFLDKNVKCANLIIDGNAVLEVTNDIFIADTLFLGANRDGELIFNNGTVANKVETDYLIFGSDLFNSQRSENVNKIVVESGGGNGVEHRLIVNNDITIATGSNGVFPDAGANFDLFTNATDNNVVLELSGEGNSKFEIEGDDDIGSNGIRFIPEFYRIIMNKGTNVTSGFEFADGFTLRGSATGTTKALTLQNGMFILGSNENDINIDLTTGVGDFTIPASSGLRVTQAQVNVSGDDAGIILDGQLIIDGGTVDMDDAIGNGNNYIEYSASGNALLQISSGTLNVGAQVRPITTANTGILKYRQTGGNVRIGTQSAPENTRGMFQIYNVGSEFTYTGGTLVIERHQTSPSIAALYLDPDVADLTGSTITIFNANTPAGQTDFRINSTVALNNLTINGTNSPVANLNINALDIDNVLTIASGASLNGSELTLTIGGDFNNNGSYDGQGNETIFNATTSQNITGTGANNFFRFTKSETGTLNLTNSIEVSDLFTITGGVLDDNGFSVNLLSDAVIDGAHNSVGGMGLVFAGAANQELRRSATGTGTAGMITVNNSNGLTIPDGNGYDFNITGGIRLQNGVFDIGGSTITLSENADITAVSPFSMSNMIRTNSSFIDGGVVKSFSAGYSQNFTFPMGRNSYTPVTFDFGTSGNTFGSSAGSLTIRLADEFHPTINDGTDALASGDINNVLQYYWTVVADGVTGLTSDMVLGYDQSQVLANEPGPAFDEDDYLSARILTFNNPDSDINKFDVTTVDETANLITFNFSGAGSNNISGDYFAGIDQAVPNNVVTYIAANGGGNISNTLSYHSATQLPTDGVPPSGAVVRIPSGNTITLDQDNIRLYRTVIEEGAVLEIDNTTNHRLGILEGTGTLRIVSNNVNANLPAFTGDFLSCSGGSLEYSGTGNYSVLAGVTALRNLTISGSGTKDLANNNIEVCENFVLNGSDFNNINNKVIDVGQDLNIASGTFNSNSGTINITNDLNLNGGTFNGNAGGNVTVRNDLNLNAGTFNVGSAGSIDLFGNITRVSANFSGGSGSSRVNFFGTTNQVVTGDFTGSDSFYRMVVRGAGLVMNNDIDLSLQLQLQNGLINTGANTFNFGPNGQSFPASGSENSYINGKAAKTIASVNGAFIFPIGGPSGWRPATVSSVSSGGLTWEAQYFEAGPTANALVDNLTPTDPGSIVTMASGEYWVISDGNVSHSGVTAKVGLSWGAASNVSSTSSEREELEVMVWNDALSSWDNLGGINFSAGHTESSGRFSAFSATSFSEQIFTLGSGDAANPLPITLTYFAGKTVGNDNLLEWRTASELNNDYFEIQRSSDGVHYSTIKIVDGQGTTEKTTNYKMLDINPLSGLNYYRLKQVDIDGTETTFNEAHFIVKLTISSETRKFTFNTFPNPATREDINLRLEADLNKPLLIQMYDLYGNVVYKNELASGEIHDQIKLVPEQKVDQGIYVITVEQGGKKINRKVVIK